MPTGHLSVCYECGGHLRLVSGPGRTFRHRGEVFRLPPNLAILTCQSCGTEWMTGEQIDELGAAVEAQKQAPLATGTGGE
jgi:NMD protein affecting ribosome stability and mRNA decay